jgi:hypothetical protein
MAGIIAANAADVQYYVTVKGLNLRQTNAAAPVILTNESPYRFVAEVLGTDTNSVTDATIKLPNKQIIALTNMTGADESVDFVLEQGFTSKKLLDGKFAAGAYTFAINSLNDGSNNAVLKLPKDAYPSSPHIANWDDAQAVESELPCVIRWDAFTNGGSNNLVALMVADTNGSTLWITPGLFETNALNGTNVSVVIPAGQLNPGQSYSAQLLIVKVAVRNTNSVPGAPGAGGYYRQTEFPIVTLPEPSTGGRVQLDASAYSISESGGAAVVTVTRVGDEGNLVSVKLATGDGTALDGTNYLGVNETLTFDNGLTSTNVAIPILNDYQLTGNRTVNISLSDLSGNAVFGSRSNAVLTIIDSQLPGAGTLQFSPASYAVSEATASLKVTVKRTSGTSGTVGVNFHTVDGSAVAGVDYFPTNGTLVFTPGKTSLTIPVRLINNFINESNATFYVALDATTGGAALGTNLYAQIVIQDNDPGGVVSLNSTGYVTNENSGFFYITVRRTGTGTLATNASVDFSTLDGSALAGVDYAATNGTLTFGTNQLAQTIAIPILVATNANGYQNFFFQLSNPQNGASLSATNRATFTIQHNAPCICISNAAYSVSEAGGNAVISLVRFGSLSTSASVNFFTTDGSAVSPTDYRATNGTVTFPINTSVRNISVPIVDNTIVQSNRSFNFGISNALGGVPLGSTSNAVVTIVDNDFPGIVQFATNKFSAMEGSNAVIKIIRTAGLAGGVTVQFSMAGGTATSGTDYSNATSGVVFNAGETNKSILVPLTLDQLSEPTETVGLFLSDVTGGATLGTVSNATLNILNNPNPNAVPLNGPLFIKGTISGVPFIAPTNTCTASSNPFSTIQINPRWNTGSVGNVLANSLSVNAFPRVLGTLLYNNDTFTCQASYQIVSVNTGASRTWSLGNANPLTTAANGTFTLDAIDYTQKLASGRFVLRLQETTGGVSGSTININGSFRVALTP